MWVRVAITFVLLLLPTALHAQAEKRIALLIGNQGYGNEIGRLSNPHNDIALLEKVLKGLGFEVTTVRDAGLGNLHQAVNNYARRVQAAGPNAVAFFYYSGHGAADASVNYLIPVDVKTTDTGELWDQSLRLTEVTRKLKAEAANATHFVVFDACRNTLKLTRTGSRALVQSKGFAPVAQESGMLIAFATAEGELASDLGVGAGPYASALAEEIVRPGFEAVTMFRNVQRRVRIAIKQEPYLGFNAMDDVYLAGVEGPKLPSAMAEAAREWERVDKTSMGELETFVRRQGSSAEADYARARIDELKKAQVTPPAPKHQPTLMEAMGSCEYLSRSECESQPICSWADDEKQCQRKSGSLSAALLEASPTSKPQIGRSCQGVETRVGSERRCLKPGDSFRDCPDCPEMVVVRAGGFMMGSRRAEEGHAYEEEPVHMVSLTKPFAVGKFEATFAEWDTCLAAGDCLHKPSDEGWGRGKNPVINVSWRDITREFLPWLSRISGRTYRLLTEAEWEYAARAGTLSSFSVGPWITPKQANFDGNHTYGGSAKGEFRRKTVEVGSFKANDFGLHDIHGNVREWVEDCWHDNYQGAPTDGSAWTTGECNDRVLRGGSWSNGPWELRSASRIKYSLVGRYTNFGFRLARTLSP